MAILKCGIKSTNWACAIHQFLTSEIKDCQRLNLDQLIFAAMLTRESPKTDLWSTAICLDLVNIVKNFNFKSSNKAQKFYRAVAQAVVKHGQNKLLAEMLENISPTDRGYGNLRFLSQFIEDMEKAA